jgi:hypothetical protein
MDFTQAISQQECKQIAMDQAERMQGLVPDDHPGALDKNAFWRYAHTFFCPGTPFGALACH